MVRFIQTQNGSYIAGSEIVNVREIDSFVCSITTRNGDHHTVEDSADNIISILEERLEVIPASPGHNAIRRIFSKEEDKWTYETRPIIGWMRYPHVMYDQDKSNVGYPRACLIFMDRFNLKRILFKTPLQNIAAIRAKEKLGFRYIGEEIISFGIIRDDTRAKVFELTKPEAEKLISRP
jgi:hypothetical protein